MSRKTKKNKKQLMEIEEEAFSEDQDHFSEY